VGATGAREAWERWDADAQPHLAAGTGRHAEAALERAREVVARGGPFVGADGVGARRGSGRGGRGPDRLAGEHGLPQRRQEDCEDWQQRDQLDRRLTALFRDAPHARHPAAEGVPALRAIVT
jgi:hypothetical protein